MFAGDGDGDDQPSVDTGILLFADTLRATPGGIKALTLCCPLSEPSMLAAVCRGPRGCGLASLNLHACDLSARSLPVLGSFVADCQTLTSLCIYNTRALMP